MNSYRVSFYDKNAIDSRDRDSIQRSCINAESETQAREIFSVTNCEVISVELVVVNYGLFTDDEIKADYQERNDLYCMGNGG
jgi:hypothetical protein